MKVVLNELINSSICILFCFNRFSSSLRFLFNASSWFFKLSLLGFTLPEIDFYFHVLFYNKKYIHNKINVPEVFVLCSFCSVKSFLLFFIFSIILSAASLHLICLRMVLSTSISRFCNNKFMATSILIDYFTTNINTLIVMEFFTTAV